MLFTVYPLHRRVISVTGPQARHFLQGLVTTDVQKVSLTHLLYSLLLTPQGKILYDFFIFQDPKDPEGIYVDCGTNEAALLEATLKKYQLRAQVEWKILETLKVYGIISHENQVFELPQRSLGGLLFKDPRLETLGWRFYKDASVEASSEVTSLLDPQSLGAQEVYRQYLMGQGVPEVGWGLFCEKSIPLECNMMELGAIDWEKGCYIGQELTARTRYRGVVRKRLLPGVFTKAPSTIEEPSSSKGVLYYQGEPIGRIEALCGTKVLCLVRLDGLPKDFQLETFEVYAKDVPQNTFPEGQEKSLRQDLATPIGQITLSQPPWIKFSERLENG